MNQNELNKILTNHKLWLETKGKEGKRANLRGADLTEADLRGADLREANLANAYLGEDDWKGIPLVLGNILVTECYKPFSYWRIKTWSNIKEENQELYEELYK